MKYLLTMNMGVDVMVAVTNRCSCYLASKQCTHLCRCTNCNNSCSTQNSSSKQKKKNTTTVVVIAGEDKSRDTDDSTDESDTKKVEEEIAPISNIEIMDWNYFIC